jgi:hypothetical protein
VVENVGVDVGIMSISYSVPEKHSTSGLESAILKYDGRLALILSMGHQLTSMNVCDVIFDSGMVKNMSVTVGISAI